MSLQSSSPVRLIAFFLPQFHPIPENDRWWGKGFTEWTNVTKAAPLFDGHYQPHLPADLGFYDLRLRAARREQIRLAKQSGIDAFCYHYYWFSGTRLLAEPLDDMLADPGSDMPFCLCWANENWTRRWDGLDAEVLIGQKFLPDDDIEFIRSVTPMLADPRYLRLDGKPLLIIYAPHQLPDPRRSTGIWREHCRTAGIGTIHLCAALTHGNEDFANFGFDSAVEFPPHNVSFENVAPDIAFERPFYGNVIQYADIARAYLARKYGNARVFRTVLPSWDNTARMGSRARVLLNGTPDNYEHWLGAALDLARRDTSEEALVFINAWNEWAEGCHLEPDRRFGHGFLQATLSARSGVRRFPDFVDAGLPVPVRQRGGLAGDLRRVLALHALGWMARAKRSVKRHSRLYSAVRPLAQWARRIR